MGIHERARGRVRIQRPRDGPGPLAGAEPVVDGRGRGLAGRKSIPKGEGHVPARCVTAARDGSDVFRQTKVSAMYSNTAAFNIMKYVSRFKEI